ncbi:MAG: GNAT family N-acetyltransferase [Actinomycetes bacterium]
MNDLVAQWLTSQHSTIGFDCGVPELNNWLRGSALRSQRVGNGRTKVWVREGQQQVVGFYTIAPYMCERAEAGLTRRFHEGFTGITGFLLGKLALDTSMHGQGLGAELLHDAISVAVHSGQQVGGQLLFVDAIDEAAAEFYEKYAFTRTYKDGLLVMRLKDAAQSLQPDP